MAHFAKIDINNRVETVIVVNNTDCGGGDFPDSETIGQEFIASCGLSGEWKQCSYNGNFRAKYPISGVDVYDAVNDVFVAPTIEE